MAVISRAVKVRKSARKKERARKRIWEEREEVGRE